MKKFILASQSPRRRALLGEVGLLFDVLGADIDETPREGEPAESYVTRLAREKAIAVAGRISRSSLIVAADTTVVLQGEILGKPLDDAEAHSMLKRLSGVTHEVITGVCLREESQEEVFSVTTSVRFRHISDADILEYLKTGEAADKAGAYGIQGAASVFVEEVRGSYTNVVGLPVDEVVSALERFGVRRDS